MTNQPILRTDNILFTVLCEGGLPPFSVLLYINVNCIPKGFVHLAD